MDITTYHRHTLILTIMQGLERLPEQPEMLAMLSERLPYVITNKMVRDDYKALGYLTSRFHELWMKRVNKTTDQKEQDKLFARSRRWHRLNDEQTKKRHHHLDEGIQIYRDLETLATVDRSCGKSTPLN